LPWGSQRKEWEWRQYLLWSCFSWEVILTLRGNSKFNCRVLLLKIDLWRYRVYAKSLCEHRFSQKILFETISELLKKDAGLCVKKHTLRLLYLVLNCKLPLLTNLPIFFFVHYYIIWFLAPFILIVLAIATCFWTFIFTHSRSKTVGCFLLWMQRGWC